MDFTGLRDNSKRVSRTLWRRVNIILPLGSDLVFALELGDGLTVLPPEDLSSLGDSVLDSANQFDFPDALHESHVHWPHHGGLAWKRRRTLVKRIILIRLAGTFFSELREWVCLIQQFYCRRRVSLFLITLDNYFPICPGIVKTLRLCSLFRLMLTSVIDAQCCSLIGQMGTCAPLSLVNYLIKTSQDEEEARIDRYNQSVFEDQEICSVDEY